MCSDIRFDIRFHSARYLIRNPALLKSELDNDFRRWADRVALTEGPWKLGAHRMPHYRKSQCLRANYRKLAVVHDVHSEFVLAYYSGN